MNQIETFEAMLARGQDSEMLRYTLGNAYFNQQEYGKAIEHLRKAVDIKPDYSAAWRVLGRALAGDGQLQAARDMQTAKEINVFRKRVIKALDA